MKKKNRTLKKKRKKAVAGRVLGQHRPEKNSAKRLIGSGEVSSPRQTSIVKTSDCVMKYEQGALVRGSDPPKGHRVHVADAGRAG